MPKIHMSRADYFADRALATHAPDEYRTCPHQLLLVRDFIDADCSVVEYLRRIGEGNLHAYANTLAAQMERYVQRVFDAPSC